MGRYSKKRKQEEARMRAENAKKTFVENILEFSEKQQEELERLERRINRKKILINKKYRVAYDKIQKEEREKQQRIFEKYDRYIEKRQNEIKGDKKEENDVIQLNFAIKVASKVVYIKRIMKPSPKHKIFRRAHYELKKL